MKKAVSSIILTMLLFNIFTLTFNISSITAVASDEFSATAYYCVYESEMDGIQTVTLTISGIAYTLKASFLFGGYGVAMQGTGRTGPGGDYVHYDGSGGAFVSVDDPIEDAQVRARYAALGIVDFTGFGNIGLAYPGEATYSLVSGVTGASGRILVPWYSIAVDPSTISLGTAGTLLFKSGTTPNGATEMRFRADDTGGAITGNRIDIYVGEGTSALNEWYQTGGNRYVEVTYGWGKSHNVAVVDDYYGSAVGYLYPSDYADQTFFTLSASQVSAQVLANYDTVILFMFNPSGLTAAQKVAINDWVYSGGKLLVWDSDQVPRGSPWDYTWLPYPFTTSVPGQTGQTGKGLNILEENQLSSSDPSSPYYIDTAILNSQTDAVGDANVLISYGPGWRIDMMATNVLGETGPAHVYAEYGLGLVIYSALDWDYAGYNLGGGAWLKKMLKQEFECSYLPFGAPTVPEEVGLDVQITANAPEGYYADKPVQFEVTVKNPTDLTGINLVAHNVRLSAVYAPEEIEITWPGGGQSTVDIAAGESKTTTFSGMIKKIANNIEVKVNAIGHTDIGPIGGSGSCCLNAHSLQTPDWSFALITDLHIGYNYQAGDLDSDGKNEIDYGGRGWDDAEPLPQESNYWLTDRLASAVDTMIAEKNYYNVRFVVVLGDISDTAEKSEFFKAREILNRLNDYGICYIPIIGNHDIWPYTQEQAPDDRGQPHDTIATYAKGDEFFKDVFWGDSNSKNVGLITNLFGDSWKSEHSTPVSLPGCDYSSYLQNYGFSYGEEGEKIDFLGLDIAPRYHQPMYKFWQTLEPDPYPGAATGGLAKIHQQTLDFENDFVSNHQQGTTAVVLAHYPLYPIAGGCIFPNSPDRILDPLAKKYGSIYDFGGHVHRNSEEAGLVTEYKADGVGVHIRETEAMARETDVLLRTLSGRFIRIVQVKDGILDCSTRLEPLKKVDITWPFPNFAYSYASYPEPNKQITFTAYFTTFHGFRTSFDWDFGDGSYGSGSSMTHTYSQDGTYNVILTVATRNLLTGEVSIMTITRPVYVHAKHVISSIPTGLSAISLLTGEDLATVPKNEYQLVLVTRNVEGQEVPIAGLAIHFEEAIGDVDLSTLIAEVEIEQAKSVLYMPSWPEEIEQYKLLFIPSTGVGTVYICSDALSLEEVSLEKADIILNVGETKDGITIAATSYNAREYYLVSGITGTGGGELKDSIPPTTTLTIGEPKYVTDITYVTRDTPFDLTATDNSGGSGVALTAYKIRNATYDSGWLTYVEPFRLSCLMDGVYSIDYNSTDNAGNVETANTIDVTLFHWNYIYQDTYGRGTTLKINLAHKFFQFIAPSKDYGIRNATCMRQCGSAIIVNHCDKQLRLITASVDTKRDFCYAMAWDLLTRKCYLLIDKAGIE